MVNGVVWVPPDAVNALRFRLHAIETGTRMALPLVCEEPVTLRSLRDRPSVLIAGLVPGGETREVFIR